MKIYKLVSGLVIATFFLIGAAAFGQAGHWEGKVVMPEQDFLVTVDLAKNAAGSWIGSLTFPNSTTVNAPLSGISVADAAVRFQLVGIEGNPKFEGTLSTDRQTLSGTAANARGAVPFEMKRLGEANVVVPPRSSMLTKEFAGDWDGTLSAGAKSMRVAMTLAPASDGTATATLVTIDDGNKSYPVSTITLNNNELLLELRVISGTYRGLLNDNGEITGEFKQGGATLSLTFKRSF